MNKRVAAVVVLAVCVLVAAAAMVILPDNDKDSNSNDEVPEGLKEIGVMVNAGGRWELNVKITINADGPSDTAAVIVHGSGPVDMDCTVGPNKMYREIAWGLAQYNVDVLRYDKRTFVYGTASLDDPAKLTVKEETINDAIAAAELMKERGYERVFLIGHSMGGMLAPAIVDEAHGLFDGFISLAGSPRIMPEIQADQNLALINSLNRAQIEQIVATEMAKLDRLDSWTESELLSNKIFGLPAYYVKDMISRDAGKIAVDLDVPMLFLQGSADSQVYADKDFKMWQDLLGDKEEAEFKLYDGLNHLFMVSTLGISAEYQLKGHVGSEIIQDIADFINR